MFSLFHGISQKQTIGGVLGEIYPVELLQIFNLAICNDNMSDFGGMAFLDKLETFLKYNEKKLTLKDIKYYLTIRKHYTLTKKFTFLSNCEVETLKSDYSEIFCPGGSSPIVYKQIHWLDKDDFLVNCFFSRGRVVGYCKEIYSNCSFGYWVFQGESKYSNPSPIPDSQNPTQESHSRQDNTIFFDKLGSRLRRSSPQKKFGQKTHHKSLCTLEWLQINYTQEEIAQTIDQTQNIFGSWATILASRKTIKLLKSSPKFTLSAIYDSIFDLRQNSKKDFKIYTTFQDLNHPSPTQEPPSEGWSHLFWLGKFCREKNCGFLRRYWDSGKLFAQGKSGGRGKVGGFELIFFDQTGGVVLPGHESYEGFRDVFYEEFYQVEYYLGWCEAKIRKTLTTQL